MYFIINLAHKSHILNTVQIGHPHPSEWNP